MEKIEILSSSVKNVRRFRLRGTTIVFKIKKIPENEDPVRWVKDAVEQVILHVCKDVEPGDKIGFTFCSESFAKEGWMNFTDAADISVEEVWRILEKLFQSNSSGLNTDTFRITSTVVNMPRGSGRVGKNKYNNYYEECVARKGIISISNLDNYCLPRAIVVGAAYAEKNENYNRIRKDTGKIQIFLAKKLATEALVTIPEIGAGIPELKKFQNHLKDKFKITVYDYVTRGRSLIFEGSDAPLKINLLHHNNHYNVITSLTAAFGCGYFCESCHVPYYHKNAHRCGGTCPGCHISPPCILETKINCSECNRYFRNENCFDMHKKNSICEKIKRCISCLKTHTNRFHVCGEIFCKTCNNHVSSPHLCFMSPLGPRRDEKLLFIFYDLETTQEKIINENDIQHVPNLCVFKQCCYQCLDSDKTVCNTCGLRLQVLTGDEIIEGFMHHILNLRRKFKKIIIMAHNGQSYDHQFILNHILTKTDLIPELIMRGTKIISMELGNIKFLDSLNYFPMALAKLPKTFGLGDNFKKGYFPHLFNTFDNRNYVGPLPSTEHYSVNTMKADDREKFLQWYEEHKNDIFDMKKEIVGYCISDVEILTSACLKFRALMIETGNVDPFTEGCTIASACNKVFRRNFLKPNTIGLIPKSGYRLCDNQSKIALRWLIWEENQRKIDIRHSGKQKEVVLHGFKVDGYCSETNEVFEFNGCYYHGCPKCFKLDRNKPLHDNPNETMNTRFESTEAKIARLQRFGYKVVQMWECDFRSSLNNDILRYTENHSLLLNSPLNPRDAFFGGRTGNVKSYYKTKENEKIKYLDVCSLYPFVCKYGKYPVGHPAVLVGSDCSKNLVGIDGLIKCKILPPQTLFHPVLPMKANNKLLFALCRTCAIEGGDCDHNAEQRAMIGTWVIDEVKKAVELGYELLEIYEIWKYDVVQYDRTKNEGGLFTEMMDKYLKIKQEASGFPKSCITEDEKEKYIEDFFNSEGIRLKFSEIIENAGLRALSKLMLNSFWGKLGQRPNQPKTKIINRPDCFFEILSNPAIVVNTVLPVNENTLVVNYEYKDESYHVLPTVNVCLAAYTTAMARLKLYSYLEMLGERVLYYDTDSVIFISRQGEPEPRVGSCVGELTDELECYGANSYITEFVCGGPKSYGYSVFSPIKNNFFQVCKVKGVTLNYEASRVINFEKIKDMILNDTPPVYITYKNIERTNLHEVVTKEKQKLFQINSRKRKFIDYDSVPFGYRAVCEPDLNLS